MTTLLAEQFGNQRLPNFKSGKLSPFPEYLFNILLDFCQVAAREYRDERIDFFDGFVPPAPFEYEVGELVVKAISDKLRWVPGHDGVGLHVAADDAACADDRAVTDMHSGEYRCVLANPYVVSDDGVALERHVIWSGCIHVPACERVERESRDCVHLVVRPVHHEFHSRCNLAELADNQLVVVPRV